MTNPIFRLSREFLLYFGGELAVSKDFFCKHCGSYIQARIAPSGTMRTSIPLAGAEELFCFVDHDLKRIGTGVIRYENRLGGEIAVLPYSIPGNAGLDQYRIRYSGKNRTEKQFVF
jgi:hypothetical protein